MANRLPRAGIFHASEKDGCAPESHSAHYRFIVNLLPSGFPGNKSNANSVPALASLARGLQKSSLIHYQPTKTTNRGTKMPDLRRRRLTSQERFARTTAGASEPVPERPEAVGEPEKRRSMQVVAGGSAAESLTGIAAVVLAIIGLSTGGSGPFYCLTIATIVAEAALLIHGVAPGRPHQRLDDRNGAKPGRGSRVGNRSHRRGVGWFGRRRAGDLGPYRHDACHAVCYCRNRLWRVAPAEQSRRPRK